MRYCIETYGCQMNKCDSELIAGLLEKAGHVQASEETADLILINTCSVRQHAEDRVLGKIASLKNWVCASPSRRLIVAGCMAQRIGEDLLHRFPYLSYVLGPDEYRRLPALLQAGGEDRSCFAALSGLELYEGINPLRSGHISGWVTIMRGCNNYCAYCIVPYTRGPERSRPADDILKEIGDMAAAGFREITLLGQNVNSYHDGKVDFAGLLRAASRVERIVRIRFMTSHPKDLSLSVLEAVAEESVLCNHIHLPVQAGSNRILKAMNRRYTREHYIRLVEQARTLIPDVAVTTDIIVGFPGESESDFMDTVDLIKTLAFDDAFTYHYSPRSGTAAYGMKDNVPREVKLARLDRIIKLQREITAKKKKALIGRTMTVMPERTSKESSLEWMGRTATDHVVVFPKASSTPGIPVRVQINSCRGYTLRGRIAS